MTIPIFQKLVCANKNTVPQQNIVPEFRHTRDVASMPVW